MKKNRIRLSIIKEIFEILKKNQKLNNCPIISDFSNIFDEVKNRDHMDSVHLNYYENKIICRK